MAEIVFVPPPGGGFSSSVAGLTKGVMLIPACAICFGCVVVGMIVGGWIGWCRAEKLCNAKHVAMALTIDRVEDAMDATRSSPLPIGADMRELSRAWGRVGRTSIYRGARMPIQSVGKVMT